MSLVYRYSYIYLRIRSRFHWYNIRVYQKEGFLLLYTMYSCIEIQYQLIDWLYVSFSENENTIVDIHHLTVAELLR